MKRLIIIILIVLFVPISYVSAGDKVTLDLAKDKTLMFLRGYIPIVAKYNYAFFTEKITKENDISDFLDSIEEQRRIIVFDRMDAENEITNFINQHRKEKVTIPSFDWAIIPNLKDSQPSGMIQFTFSF
jgi:hypothetical protein